MDSQTSRNILVMRVHKARVAFVDQWDDDVPPGAATRWYAYSLYSKMKAS
jgi:hypothetical protein